MKKLALLAVFVSLTLAIAAQDTAGLRKAFQAYALANDDSARVQCLFDICGCYVYANADSALYFANAAEALSVKSNYWYGKFNGNCVKAYIYALKRADTLALKYISLALGMAVKQNDTRSIIEAYRNYALIYIFIGEFKKAIEYSSREAVMDSMMIREDSSFRLMLAGSFFYRAQAYYELGQLGAAYKYLEKGEAIFNDFHFVWSLKFILAGNIYRKQGLYDSALANLYKGLTLARQQANGVIDISNASLGIAQCYYALHKFDSSLLHAYRAFNLTAKGDFPDLKLIATQLLSAQYAEMHNIDSAFRYLTIAGNIKDSLFTVNKIQADQRVGFDQRIQEQQQLAAEQQWQNNIKLMLLAAGLAILMAIAFILNRHNRQKKKAYTLLQHQKQQTDIQKEKAERTLAELKGTQAQLIQAAKMASLGELTAGIAHEIQNPLNFVNNFSEVSNELVEELVSEKAKVKGERDEQLEDELLADIKLNLEKINHHGKRADSIVKGMLEHSRTSTGQKEATNINALADEYLRLAYHGLRAKDKNFTATLNTEYDGSIGKINIIPQDIGRVLLNIYNNAFYAVNEKGKIAEHGYQPAVTVSTKRKNGTINITVADNGNGIPQKIIDKIFQPFFTTKPTGLGTGLGLSLSYDIIKAHGGEIKVESKEGEGTIFIISLPAT